MSETSEPLSDESFEVDVISEDDDELINKINSFRKENEILKKRIYELEESKYYEDLLCNCMLLNEQYESLKEKYYNLMEKYNQDKLL